MEHWSFQGILLRISAVILILLAVFDLTKLGLLAVFVSIAGDTVSILPEPLRSAFKLLVSVSQALLAIAAAFSAIAMAVAVLLLRFAGRVEAGLVTAAERDMWLIALTVLAVLSALLHKWLYLAAFIAALIGSASISLSNNL
jgi:succinate dehydrogenase hydrophobic anchor subunit